MGHTLVTEFDEEGIRKISNLLSSAGIRTANKIPFGRNTDREIANSALPYHVTVTHWGKQEDDYYLENLNHFQFYPCTVKADHAAVISAAENSLLLYLEIVPDKGWQNMMNSLHEATGAADPFFLHMTISVSKNHSLILDQYNALKGFEPFLLNVSGLALYHIWNPVKLLKTFHASKN